MENIYIVFVEAGKCEAFVLVYDVIKTAGNAMSS
jgi:hypothetical protein